MTESILFGAYRSFENVVHDAFVLYCLEKRNNDGKKAVSYLHPKSFEHAEELIRGSMRHLDWTDPDEVIRRAERYLRAGDPVKSVFAANRTVLKELKDLRNHIAHNSRQSGRAYVSLLQRRLGTAPLRTPTVGEFLLMQDRNMPARYYLMTYLEALDLVCESLTG